MWCILLCIILVGQWVIPTSTYRATDHRHKIGCFALTATRNKEKNKDGNHDYKFHYGKIPMKIEINISCANAWEQIELQSVWFSIPVRDTIKYCTNVNDNNSQYLCCERQYTDIIKDGIPKDRLKDSWINSCNGKNGSCTLVIERKLFNDTCLKQYPKDRVPYSRWAFVHYSCTYLNATKEPTVTPTEENTYSTTKMTSITVKEEGYPKYMDIIYISVISLMGITIILQAIWIIRTKIKRKVKSGSQNEGVATKTVLQPTGGSITIERLDSLVLVENDLYRRQGQDNITSARDTNERPQYLVLVEDDLYRRQGHDNITSRISTTLSEIDRIQGYSVIRELDRY